jgi:hypothetical protein
VLLNQLQLPVVVEVVLVILLSAKLHQVLQVVGLLTSMVVMEEPLRQVQ